MTDPVDPARAQVAQQQVTAGEHVQGQVAVPVIVGMEEPLFLESVQGRVVALPPVVVQILISQGQGVDALPQQITKTVTATGLAASILQRACTDRVSPNRRSTWESSWIPPLPVMSPPLKSASTWRRLTDENLMGLG